jgi:iron complex transport system substrate-binding protein
LKLFAAEIFLCASLFYAAGFAHAQSAAAPSATTNAPVFLKDDWGRQVNLPTKPTRLITLSAHLTEMAFEAGLGQQIIAVDLHSRMVASALENVVRLSAYPEPSMENIAKLKPDLVLLWGAGLKATSVSRLESIGIKVFVSEPKVMGDIVATLEMLHSLSPLDSETVKKRVERYKLSLQPRVYSRLVPVFVQVWSDPLMTIGQNGFIANALKHCGADVLLAPRNQSSAVINPEAVVLGKARVIVSSNLIAAMQYWSKRAPKKTNSWSFIVLPESALSQPSTKLLDSLAVLCERLDSLR